MKIFFTFVVFFVFVTVASQVSAYGQNAILGVWQTDEGDAKIKIYKKGDKFYGKLLWVKTKPDQPNPKDKNNPNESLRNRPIKGLELLKHFAYVGDNQYEDGSIYDPKSGNTYKSTMKLRGEELDIRGYVGFSWMGRTETWYRPK